MRYDYQDEFCQIFSGCKAGKRYFKAIYELIKMGSHITNLLNYEKKSLLIVMKTELLTKSFAFKK